MSPYWLVVLLVAIFGAALLGRRRESRPPAPSEPTGPALAPLRPGETYDTAVKLATVENAPLADLWCQRLGDEEIEAFSKPAQYLTGAIYSGLRLNPGLPTEIWIGEHDAERARQLFPELA